MGSKKPSTLAEVCARGPWTVSTWSYTLRKSVSESFTGDDLVTIYRRLAEGLPIERALLWQGSDRRSDRALQLLRKSGLIEYTGTPKQWRVVGSADV